MHASASNSKHFPFLPSFTCVLVSSTSSSFLPIELTGPPSIPTLPQKEKKYSSSWGRKTPRLFCQIKACRAERLARSVPISIPRHRTTELSSFPPTCHFGPFHSREITFSKNKARKRSNQPNLHTFSRGKCLVGRLLPLLQCPPLPPPQFAPFPFVFRGSAFSLFSSC